MDSNATHRPIGFALACASSLRPPNRRLLASAWSEDLHTAKAPAPLKNPPPGAPALAYEKCSQPKQKRTEARKQAKQAKQTNEQMNKHQTQPLAGKKHGPKLELCLGGVEGEQQ